MKRGGPRAGGGRPAAAPAAWAAAAFVAGVASGARASGVGPSPLVLAGACALFVAVRFRRGRAGPASAAAGFLLFASLGFAEGAARIAEPARIARDAVPWRDAEQAETGDRVEGILEDFWTGEPPRARVRMRAERLRKDGRWRAFPAEVFVFVSGEESVRAVADRGDRVQATGRLRFEDLPSSDRDIPLPWPAFRLSVKSARLLEKTGATWISALSAPNRWLFSRLPASGPVSPEFARDVRGPLAALLLGRTSELDRGMVARYRRGGMYHLLVIAGLHVGLTAGIVLLALRAASVRGRRRDAALLAAVALFVVVGGGNPPAARAAIVFAVFALARRLERPIAPFQAIGLSALVLIAAAPEQVFSIGTVLTFAAVSGIAAFAGPLRSRLPARPGFLWSGFAAAVAAQAATAPILLWRFNVVAAGAWLTAPLTLPVAAALIAVGFSLLLAFSLAIPAGPLAVLFASGSRLLETLAERASGAAFLRPTPPLTLTVGVCALVTAGALCRGRPRAALLAAGACLFLFLALRPGPGGPERGFSLEALDVGQGDALLLRWRRHAVLVDGGGPFDADARDFGRTHLLPKLLDRGVTRLDAAVLTHPHPDHALGLFAVVSEIPVGMLLRSAGDDEGDLYRDIEAAAHAAAIPVSAARQGTSIRWPGARFDVLHSGGFRTKRDAVNNQSLVARFERDGRSALLTGDAGAFAEAEMLRARRTLRADLLKVGHHGSRGSTTPAFLQAVGPRAALLSCGRLNRFGHPAPETLANLAAAGVPVFRTDVSSDIRIELGPGATRLRKRDLP